MVVFKKKFYFFKITDIWFSHKFNFKDLIALRVYNYINNPDKLSFFYKKDVSYTLTLSLFKSIEEIFTGFSSTNKNEINKALKIGVETKYVNDLDLFVSMYNSFAKAKNIYPVKKKLLMNIGSSLHLSFAYFNNSPLAAHAYIADKDTGIVRLFLSGSKRLNDSAEKKIVGFSNKLLMFHDMKYFKKNNYLEYDFGGFAKNTTNKSLQGINDFKKSFGGVIKESYSYYTLLYYYLKKLTEKIDKRYN